MTFDLGQMMEQFIGSLTGNYGSSGNGSKNGGGGDEVYDVAVVGYGPAGGVMATLLAEKHGFKVCIVDPSLEKQWIPNYGVWVEEWEALDRLLQIGLGECLDRTWDVTDSYFGGSHGVPNEERCRINRAYGRVSRNKMQANLKARLDAAGVAKIKGKVDAATVKHASEGTTVCLDDGVELRCRLLLDCTGHYSELVEKDGVHNPGVQIAYGAEVEVKDGHEPYDEKAMLFMDYRTDYVSKDDLSAQEAKELEEVPTFLYAMPMGQGPEGRKRIFFEETSLVARPPISFDLCKERLKRRLEHHGIEVTKLLDEELCYIPMGGALPKLDQRVVAFGGASGLVHASTGYMHVRMLAASFPVAHAIARELKKGGPGAPAAAARRAYQALWPAKAKLQRDFHVFGGEFLMAQHAPALRGFFNGFFKIPLPLWAGFLSGYPNLPYNERHQDWQGRFSFGVQFFFKLPPAVQLKLALAGAANGWKHGLLQAVTPLAESAEAVESGFDAEIEAIRRAADAKTTGGDGADGDGGKEGETQAVAGRVEGGTKELTSVSGSDALATLVVAR
uniref:lycopene beta-cyclase n=1 Tax=Dictyopteris undulata TaxID=156997 RepID=A0A290WNJ9_9PHAE|nr:lycopene beta-cyclase [Dictyopteris undulata]